MFLVIAFSDNSGYIHIYNPSESSNINPYSHPTVPLVPPYVPPDYPFDENTYSSSLFRTVEPLASIFSRFWLPSFSDLSSSPLTNTAQTLMFPDEIQPKLFSHWSSPSTVYMPHPPEPLPSWLFGSRIIQKDFVQVIQVFIFPLLTFS